ncbi:hypothetical protein [Streptomyces sp. NPDC059874]|uniref:hypothetical protein n=1 Tax=Streptomyces sp. NPDC059874 TaxID=3346983 RepID=UPI00366A032C
MVSSRRLARLARAVSRRARHDVASACRARGAQSSPAIQRAARTMLLTIASTCWGCMAVGSTAGR